MLHSTRFFLATLMLSILLLGARPARAQERHDAPAAPKSTGTALLLAGGLTLGGLWAGNAMYRTQVDHDGNGLGVTAVVAWDVYDLVVLPRAVAEHNARARLQAMPAVAPIPGGWAASMTWQL